MLDGWLWLPLTLAGVTLQTMRNLVHRSLLEHFPLDVATSLRFVFALPFVLVFAVVQLGRAGWVWPALPPAFFGWILLGAAAQVLAAALLLSAMRARGFVVTIALTKTEPIHVALLSLVLLGEPLTAGLAVAVLLAALGVGLLSVPSLDSLAQPDIGQAAALGTGAAILFGISGVAYRAATLLVPGVSPFLSGSIAVAAATLVQAMLFLGWIWHRRAHCAAALRRHWRAGLLLGGLAGLASQFWFAAYALQSATLVATVALIEVPLAKLMGRRYLVERLSLVEWAGVGLLLAGVVAVIHR